MCVCVCVCVYVCVCIIDTVMMCKCVCRDDVHAVTFCLHIGVHCWTYQLHVDNFSRSLLGAKMWSSFRY